MAAPPYYTMKKFIVLVREVHVARVHVEADSPEDAIMAVREGDGDYGDETEYSHTLDPEAWTVEETA